jgi:hypothetical protein
MRTSLLQSLLRLALAAALVLPWAAHAVSGVTHCDLVGEGAIPSGDVFRGALTATLGGEGSSGSWEHWTPCETGDGLGCERSVGGDDHPGGGPLGFHPGRSRPLADHFVGIVDAAVCIPNGVVLIDVLGHGWWNGRPGYSFVLTMTDSVPDRYYIEVTGSDGVVVHEAIGDLTEGGFRTTLY